MKAALLLDDPIYRETLQLASREYVRKLLMWLGPFIVLTSVASPQTTVPMNGSCTVTYNSDGSANLVCTTSAVVAAAPVSVVVSPASATVQVGGQIQFTATVTGTGNQTVRWSTTAGTISSAGLLTAPSTTGLLTVTATSLAYPAVSASASVTITNSGPGAGGSSSPTFTGNSCTGTSSCTLNNVAAGDFLIIGSHQSFPPVGLNGQQTITDTQPEIPVFDAMNLGAGLQTWHISPVVNSGTHTITVSNFGGGDMYIAEFSGVASGNPVEAVAQNFVNSSATDTVAITTQTANDLLYGFGRSAPSGSQQGVGFTAIRTTPTMEYATAPTAGIQTVTVQPLNNPGTAVGVQALAVRPAGSTAPPVNSPMFTGNFCVQNAGSCTLKNIKAGDMLIISGSWHGAATDNCQISDTGGETISVDRQNDTISGTPFGNLSLATWHIANVLQAGTHTISVNGGGGSCWNEYTIDVFEFTNQNSTMAIDAVAYNTGLAGSTATVSLVTSQPNDLIYAFCAVPDNTTSETGNGFASIAVFPTVEYRAAASKPGTETATCPTAGNWGIQELAIRH
jgi:Bacterial Ig-like domain (group 2)